LPHNRARGIAAVSVRDIAPLPGAAAGLVVLGSTDPGLPAGKVYPLKDEKELSFGRGGRSAILLSDLYASVDHAAVSGRDGQFWLEDRGSKNGTYLNDIRIDKSTVLADGDRIRIGDVTMQFVRWSYEVESGNRSGPHKEAKRG
jgi:pSer/pThr/pTyr-binding forkhead associated (FHA) protein